MRNTVVAAFCLLAGSHVSAWVAPSPSLSRCARRLPSSKGTTRVGTLRAPATTAKRATRLPPSHASPIVNPADFGLTSVGSPVVHRYERDEGAEYALWFHGRDKGIEADVVKLNTGRIYKAKSNDGLTWELQQGLGELGSSLDVNTDEWWGFDTAHLGLGDVRLGNPDKVMTLTGGVYSMYYMGGTYDKMETKVLTGNADATGEVTGMQLRIGIALSQDGLNWSRLEGEHPTGCALDLAKEAASFDNLAVGWPQVVNHKEQVFRMYYTALGSAPEAGASPAFVVGIATSADSFKWDRLGPVFGGSGGGPEAFDAAGVMRAQVLKLGSEDGDTGSYTMIYEGKANDGTHSIGLATSPDGISWGVGNGGRPILQPDPTNAWEAKSVGSPRLVRMGGDGALRLYYVGTAEDGQCAIGAADGNLDDLGTWNRIES